MSKDAYYFSHDTNARTDPKVMAMLLEYKAEGYGFYWALVEMLSEQDEYRLKLNKINFSAIAMAMLSEASIVENFVNSCISDYELFESDEDWFWSNSLIRRMELKEEKRQKRVAAGKKGAEVKWNNGNAIATADQPHDNVIAKDGKGNKRKEIKEMKEMKEVPVKTKYADRVTLSEDEYQNLVVKYSKAIIESKIIDLDLWKGSKGKTTSSDYLTILTWLRKKPIENRPKYKID
ncbi:MAG: DUF4373 domain-containing protein [Clostridium sp.]